MLGYLRSHSDKTKSLEDNTLGTGTGRKHGLLGLPQRSSTHRATWNTPTIAPPCAFHQKSGLPPGLLLSKTTTWPAPDPAASHAPSPSQTEHSPTGRGAASPWRLEEDP